MNFKLTFIAVLFTIVGSAQDEKISPDRKTEIRERINTNQERLGLSAEQHLKYAELNKRFAAEIRAVTETRNDRDAKIKALREIQAKKDAEVKAILSDQQYEIYLEIQAENAKSFRERRKK